MGSVARQQLEEWLAEKECYGKVLDVGGSQNPLSEKRVKNFKAHNYTILDLPYPHEGTRAPDIPFDIQSSLDTGYGPGVYYENQFDQVYCLEVSEYWYDPIRALKNINYFMRQGASLFISFHWLYGLHNPKGEDCIRYSRNGIQKMLEAAGFQIDEMIAKHTTDAGKAALEKFYRMEGMRLDFKDMNTYVEGYLVKCIKR